MLGDNSDPMTGASINDTVAGMEADPRQSDSFSKYRNRDDIFESSYTISKDTGDNQDKEIIQAQSELITKLERELMTQKKKLEFISKNNDSSNNSYGGKSSKEDGKSFNSNNNGNKNSNDDNDGNENESDSENEKKERNKKNKEELNLELQKEIIAIQKDMVKLLAKQNKPKSEENKEEAKEEKEKTMNNQMKVFAGRVNENVDQWVLAINLNMDAANVKGDRQMKIAAGYLTEAALQFYQQEMKKGSVKWEDFQKDLIKRFRPSNYQDILYNKLNEMRQQSCITKHIEHFMFLMNQAENISGDIKRNLYLNSLNKEIAANVRYRQPQNLEEAIQFSRVYEESFVGKNEKHEQEINYKVNI